VRRPAISLVLVVLLSTGVAWAADDLAAAWDFRGATAAAVPDASGHGNGGTLDGGVQPIVGGRGPALFFPPADVAVGPIMAVGAGPETNLHEFTSGLTLEAFVQPDVLPIPPGPTGLRLRYIVWADDDVYSLYLRGDDAGNTTLGGGINCGRSASGRADVGASAPFENARAGSFSHVALTFADGSLRLYVDGAEVALVTDGGVPPCGSHVGPVSTLRDVVQVGGDEVYFNGQRNWRGTIDDVKIWSRALSAPEIAQQASTPGCAVADDCDDGDACTTATCTNATCATTHVPGAGGVACEVDKVKASDVCDEPLVKALDRLLERRANGVLAALRKLGRANPARLERLRGKADRGLRKLDALLQTKRFASLAPACLGHLHDLVADARGLLAEV
jgi:hypothetical protein